MNVSTCIFTPRDVRIGLQSYLGVNPIEISGAFSLVVLDCAVKYLSGLYVLRYCSFDADFSFCC